VQDSAFTLQVRTRIPVAPRDVNYADVTMLERSKVGMNSAAKLLIGVGVGFGALMLTLAALFAGD
jgi:hypothetical protein